MDSAPKHVFNAGDADFATAVLVKSQTVPVVVDFWAPWCGPCRTIGPVLERLAEENAGAFLLAKVNVDENPELSRAYRISGIPHVMAFDKGRVATEFTGAVPESTIREFISRILPSESETLAAQARKKLAAGRSDEAWEIFQKALDLDALNGAALVGLAEIETARGHHTQALARLEQVPPGAEREAADRLAARLRVSEPGVVDEESLRRRLNANPKDLAARLDLARSSAALGRYEEAFENYLEIVRQDRSFEDDAGRRGIVDLFQVLGRDHPLTEKYRAELSQILFA